MQKLLIEIAKISEKYNAIKQKTGSYFNIFEITNIKSDEVTICRVLYELINPHGSHCQGDIYLRLFVRDVLKLNFSEQDYNSARVVREQVIDNMKRIDLYIHTTNLHIPIEVKIYAADGENQCKNYYEWVKKRTKNPFVYYLTLEGRMPSAESVGDLKKQISDNGEIIGYEGIKQISFSNDIIKWLDSCVTHSETVKIAPIREILFQLKDVVAKLTGQLQGDEKVEIVNAILASPENISSALGIERALPAAKAKIMTEFFCELRRLFEISGKKICFYSEDIFAKYYSESKKHYPCLWIEVKRFAPKLTAILGVEVDDRLYFTFGFMIVKEDGKVDTISLSDVSSNYPEYYAAFEQAVTGVMVGGNRSWNKVFWEYIFDDRNRRYNFKYPEDELACIDLSRNNEEHCKRIYELLNDYYDRVVEKLPS